MVHAAALAAAAAAAAAAYVTPPQPAPVGAAYPSPLVNVLDHGADPTGAALSTRAFQAGVAAVAAAGGGTLYAPPGTYLLSPLNLTGGLTLLLDGCTLRATTNFSLWRTVAPLPSYGRGRNNPGPRVEAFLQCWGCAGFRLTSNSTPYGVVDGSGAPWWYAVKHGFTSTPGHLLELAGASHAEVDHVELHNSPFWTTHVWNSTDVWLHDFVVLADKGGVNVDGVDIDSSARVTVERANLTSADDCVAIKAGWAPWATWHDGVRSGFSVPTVDATIRDVTCATPSGCIAVGSEMSGGVENVTATRIHCVTAGWGFNVKSALGRGGYIRNVTFADVVLGPGRIEYAVLEAGDTYTDRFPAAPVNATLVPIIDGLTIRNVSFVGPPGSYGGPVGAFTGLGGAGNVTGVVLQDVRLAGGMAPGGPGWTCANATGVAVNVDPPPCAELAGGR